MYLDPQITVVLGPTNTGKTYFAIDRMLGHESGMIGFPLRLLARENYDRIVARIGLSQVALITGEEKIIPKNARYFCCTVEAMPLEKSVSCLVIDEVQLAGDRERGHIFTDRILHARGKTETIFLGAETIRPLLKQLLPEARFDTRARLSRLTYSGPRKVTRLQRRSAIVAFSAADVYQLAELVRRQRGGAAVVMGALSPRTRNAQVEMYQNGEVDFLIATDAIGMGLNMDIQHVALAADVKFDGKNLRHLAPAEIAQIAGRAGRHTSDGTFGVTESVRPLEQEMIDAIEGHFFRPLRNLYWRSRNLAFGTVHQLLKSLEMPPPYDFLNRKADAIDHKTLEALSLNADVMALADTPGRVRLLWDVAQIPDFRNMMTDSHAVMLARIFVNLAKHGQLERDWVASQMTQLDRLDGDIDALMTRIAHIRTWTYITHKTSWTDEPENWQNLSRSIEDRLSDELHNRLTQRFVDRRAAHLSRRLKEATPLIASVKLDGTVLVEGEEVGTLSAFSFTPAINESDEKAVILSAARKALPEEIERRVKALQASEDLAFQLDGRGHVTWREAQIARLVKSDSLYAPRAEVKDSDLLTDEQKSRISERLTQFVANHVETTLSVLKSFQDPQVPEGAEPLSGHGRGILYQLYEGLGALNRSQIAAQLRELPETDKPHIARSGIRLGIETIYMPDMLKPAPIKLRVLLYSLFHDDFPESGPPGDGRVSIEVVEGVADAYWLAAGYRRIGDKVMRVDMVERVAALVRAAAREGQFKMSDEMLSLAGVSRETMALMLIDLGCKQVSEEPSEDPEKPATPIFEREMRKRGSQKQHREGDGGEPSRARRAGKSNSGKSNSGQSYAGKKPHRGKSDQHGGQDRRPAHQRKAEKQPDPNSPFAVLAALKKR